jgi:hypothetical protein
VIIIDVLKGVTMMSGSERSRKCRCSPSLQSLDREFPQKEILLDPLIKMVFAMYGVCTVL